MLKLPEHRVRVIAPEVGGGFGSKIPAYPDEALCCFAAMDTGRPVKWTEDRSENYKVTIHGRDHIEYVEMCGTKDGRITGIRTRVYAGLGAYVSTAGRGIPTILHGLVYSGADTIPNIEGVIHGVYTNGTPGDAYRDAGRPEAAYLVERPMDIDARTIGMDPVEVRRKNFIPKDELPYTVATGLIYDSGDYEAALDKALGILDCQAFRAEQVKARKAGRYLGVGVVSYIEICGLGPSQVAGAVGFGAGLYDSAIVRVYPTGMVKVYIGASPHGQFAFPFGTHVCTVEVEADTGKVNILRYIAVNDCGPPINPTVVDGQIRGGVIQGLGEALQEIAVYKERCPVVEEVAGEIADIQVRNGGTIGGSLAHADPASDIPALMIALDAEFQVRSKAGGKRSVKARDWFKVAFTTDLGERELFIDITIPGMGRNAAAYVSFDQAASGRPSPAPGDRGGAARRPDRLCAGRSLT